MLFKDFSILTLLARIFLEFFKLSTFKVPPTLILSVLLISLEFKFSLTTIFPLLLRVAKLIFSLIISPSLFTFPFIEILSKLFTLPLFFKLFATSIFEFACIFPLLFKDSFICKELAVEIFPVFSKFLTLISLFAFNSFVFFKSLELNFELVKILPLLLAFSKIFIFSMA